MGPRLDGQSTTINFLIWVGFAHHFDAGADICADADVNILHILLLIFSAEELTEHAQEELYGGGTSEKTISSLQVFYFSCPEQLNR